MRRLPAARRMSAQHPLENCGTRGYPVNLSELASDPGQCARAQSPARLFTALGADTGPHLILVAITKSLLETLSAGAVQSHGLPQLCRTARPSIRLPSVP